MPPTAPAFPRLMRRSSILSQPSGRRSEPLAKNATVVLAELLLQLERRTTVALSRPNDDNLTVPLGLPSSCIRSVVNCTLCGMAGVGRRPGRLRDEFGGKFIEPKCRPGRGQT